MKEIKKEILHRIWELWELMPEQRFGQLLDNCVIPRNEDFFYTTDAKVLVSLENTLQTIKEKQIDRKVKAILENKETREKLIEILRDKDLI